MTRALSLDSYKIESRGFRSPCWIWQGFLNASGYGGRIRVNGVYKSPHRAMFEREVGPIPAGLHIDHLCQQPACINPTHLEPVTPKENARRVGERSTHCRYGHPWTPESTMILKVGVRRCKICRNAYARAHWPETKLRRPDRGGRADAGGSFIHGKVE